MSDLSQLEADLEPTELQRELADFVDLNIERDTRRVAAVRLRVGLHEALNPGAEPPEPATANQIEYAHDLGVEVEGESKRVASAIIEEELYRQNKRAIERLNLTPGTEVKVVNTAKVDGEEIHTEKRYTISSIGDDLRVYFKGRGSNRAWPSQLQLVDDE